MSTNYSYSSSSQEEAKTPILTSIYNVIGFLWILAGAGAAVIGMRNPETIAVGIAAAAMALFIALVCFGVAQVVMLIAKIEFNTRATDASYQMVNLLKQIVKNTSGPDSKAP